MPQVLLVLGLRLSGMFLLIHTFMGAVSVATWHFSGRIIGNESALLINRLVSEVLLNFVAALVLIAKAPRIGQRLTPPTALDRAGPARLLLAGVAMIGVIALVTAITSIAALILHRTPSDGVMWAMHRSIDGQNLLWYLASALAGFVAVLLPLLWSRLQRRGATDVLAP